MGEAMRWRSSRGLCRYSQKEMANPATANRMMNAQPPGYASVPAGHRTTTAMTAVHAMIWSVRTSMVGGNRLPTSIGGHSPDPFGDGTAGRVGPAVTACGAGDQRLATADPISTRAILLTPLSAITMFLPSSVVLMLRTTPPPPGMIQLWNFSVLRSKRTSTFGLIADSTYQIAPPW